MTNLPVGSEAWNNGSRYSPEWQARLRYMLAAVPDEVLVRRARAMRRSAYSCTVSERFSAGNYNIVRQLVFDDGLSWVIRLRMPGPEEASWTELVAETAQATNAPKKWKWTEQDQYAMRSEIATMVLVRNHTSIPIPHVHMYSVSHNNMIGFPYIIMEYVHGTTAFDQSTALGDPMCVPEEYQAHFFAQVARIMVELASIRFGAIGSVFQLDQTAGRVEQGLYSKFAVGPCADTNTGNYMRYQDFYADYPVTLAAKLNINDSRHSDLEPVGSGIARALKQQRFAQSEPESADFPLVNLELGTHNILVDASYTILSVIDWDSTFALPAAATYMFPFCSGAEPGVPGATVQVSPICPPLNEKRRKVCNAFARAFGEAAKSQSHSPPQRLLRGTAFETLAASRLRHNDSSSHAFWSKEALAFRCLLFLRAKQDWVDEAWVPGLQWLLDHSDEDVRKAYAVV